MDNRNGVPLMDILTKVHEGPYRPTIKEVRVWFAFLNALIFGGRVPKFRDIKLIDRTDRRFGACGGHDHEGDKWCVLELRPEFEDFTLFLAVLGHEMVHAYQWMVLDRSMSHGQYFWTWSKKFKKYGIPLRVRY